MILFQSKVTVIYPPRYQNNTDSALHKVREYYL